MHSRRRFIGSMLGALAAVGFDASTGTFLTRSAAAQPGRTFQRLPRLDGSVSVVPAERTALSGDVGNVVFETPAAVLRPGSAEDIAQMIRFCRRAGIPVAARGQGHATDGQSLVGGGLAIEMASLSTLHRIGKDEAVVDAGATWRSLVGAGLGSGLVPPVLTGYLGLSLGGTLSMGGISSTVRRGAQLDHARALEVVTGEGKIVSCSERRNRDLFEAVLGGLGQFGVITRATVAMVRAPTLARVYQLVYGDNATFFADLRSLLARGELDDAYGLWVPGPAGFTYVVVAARFYDPGSEPDDTHLLRDLHDIQPARSVSDAPFAGYVSRVDAAVAQLTAAGLWDGVVHPWLDVFLPESAVESYIGEVIPTLSPEDVGQGGFMLLFPQRRDAFTRPMLRLPEGPWVYLFDILTANARPGRDPAFAARMLARNRALFDKASAVGGTRYPIGSLRFDRADWRAHYGERYGVVERLKAEYDPSGILTPGIRTAGRC
jgi:cytokinin dehydrogenase